MASAKNIRRLARDVSTAVRRYNHVRGRSTGYDDPGMDRLRAAFDPLIGAVRGDVESAEYLHLDGKRPPWTATGTRVREGQEVSVFATGRLWRSRPRDLWIRPQLGLWCRLGENGAVFNSTHDTNTFEAESSADLYLATQFPGQFADPTGRVQPPLQAYDKADGGFAVLVILWRDGASAPLREMAKLGDPFGLLGAEIGRQDRPPRKPEDWKFLWFLGVSDIFSEGSHHGARCIRCRTRGNVGILQKDVVLPLTPDTELRWDWLVSALPSRLREDTSASHDYLSVAVEFENGRDITYHWSWELPPNYGYWCPLPTWRDREFHVVVRSGTKDVGAWLSERRNLFEDYRSYMGRPPERILRVWLIASSRWQRFEGDMSIKNVQLASSRGTTDVT